MSDNPRDLVPTCYFRFERRDLAAPSRVLQQWWTDEPRATGYMPPEQCTVGEWRDVITVPEDKTPDRSVPALLRTKD